jgi:hypothetical protein
LQWHRKLEGTLANMRSQDRRNVLVYCSNARRRHGAFKLAWSDSLPTYD